MNKFFIGDDVTELQSTDKVLFRTSSEFSMFITSLANKNDDSITYTLLNYCEERDIDPEDIAKLVSKPLKELLAKEMQESGLLKKDSSAELEF